MGDPILESNLTRRVDFARFMVEAIENDELVHEAPAIVGCQTPSALAHAANGSPASAAKPSTQRDGLTSPASADPPAHWDAALALVARWWRMQLSRNVFDHTLVPMPITIHN